MCGVTLMDRKNTKELMDMIGLQGRRNGGALWGTAPLPLERGGQWGHRCPYIPSS